MSDPPHMFVEKIDESTSAKRCVTSPWPRMTFCHLLLLAGLGAAAIPATAADQPASVPSLELGSRLELFVDDFLIEKMDGVRLKLHEPRSAGAVMVFDQPWEGVTSACVTVFGDGDRISVAVDWKHPKGRTDTSPLQRLAGKAIRLRFVMRDADIYSLQFK